MKSLQATDWRRVGAALDATGCAMLDRILAPADCQALIALYADGARFRKRVVMAQHGFGRGEYQYLCYPLPSRVAELRAALYPPLARSPTGGMRRLRAPSAFHPDIRDS